MTSLLQVSNCPNLSKVLRPKESVNTVDGADIYYVKMTAVIIWIRNLIEDEDSFSKLGSVGDPIRNLVVLGTKEEKYHSRIV